MLTFPTHTLYIRLAEIEPAVWRRVIVPGQLHHVLQVTMGWAKAAWSNLFGP